MKPLQSRLPHVGTTIFTTMSALAEAHGAVNLGQGFPDFGCDPALRDAVSHAMRGGHNQYAPMAGCAPLREAIAHKFSTLYGHRYDPATEITVTAGATQAILTALLAVVHPGDEVIVLEPCYDSYVPAIEMAGGVPIRVALTPGDFRPDFAALEAALSPRTRALIVNTPHNPSGRIWSAAEMRKLGALLHGTEVIVISDEVYEHMVFDGAAHQSVARHNELAERSFAISSFGKTYHVTGWKIGYVAAPAVLMAEFRKIHQYNVFSVNTPMQLGLSAYMAEMRPILELPRFYQAKRDLFRAGLAHTRLKLLPCEGSYFQCVDYGAVSSLPEREFCEWLTREVGVAAIPLSAFQSGGAEQGIARFCFAKKDATLKAALAKLKQL
jgi:methionine aminotransferase